ncbi:hypothetical protein, partial [Streptomyces rimosus]|uniref:hypothetical protein n=1 Tax=Streptomyces rimosus TaxID=1927 RepID=UPI0033EE163B
PPAHRFLNQMVGVIPSLGEELGVVAEQHLDALPGPASALGRVDAGRQPERNPCVINDAMNAAGDASETGL